MNDIKELIGKTLYKITTGKGYVVFHWLDTLTSYSNNVDFEKIGLTESGEEKSIPLICN